MVKIDRAKIGLTKDKALKKKQEDYNSETSFSTIIATIGAILIFVGVAWLLANNWHVIPSAIKILILFCATISAYYLGTYLQINEFNKLGHSLFVLGSLLYTLSIFLIAQIFSTSASLQGTAHLLLLSWIGVIIASYVFDSLPSLTVGFVEFLIWISMQYFAFEEFSTQQQPIGLLLFIYLFIDILFYGLSLIQKNTNPEFSIFYKWWCALYFLIFGYVATFQETLPKLWTENLKYNSAFYFMSFIFIISLITLICGLKNINNDKHYNKKELWLVIVCAIVLSIIILSSNTATKNYGICEHKFCSDYNTASDCKGAEVCDWTGSYCTEKHCGLAGINVEMAPKPINSKINLQKNLTEYCADKTEAQYEYFNDKYFMYNCYVQNDKYSNTSFCYYNVSTKRVFELKNYINCSAYGNNRDSCSLVDQCAYRTQSYYGNRIKPTFGIWILWISSNIFFIILLLSIIGLGTIYKSKSAINLGIVFFILDILTRYIGFMMDYWGYTSLSVFFITGGIILILGGYYIEKWRQNLLQKIQ